MNNRSLGRTGLLVSEIGHGLWGMGSWTGSDDLVSLNALQESAALGCSFYDSAWAYGDGHSDRLLGSFVSDQDARITVTSKLPPKDLKFPAESGDQFSDSYPLDHVKFSAHQICSALRVEVVPLIQFHTWHDEWLSDPEFQRVISWLRESGVAKYVGISLNRWEPWNGVAAVKSGLFDSVQVIYNVFDQAPEDELFPACEENGVGVIARVPLDEGSLGGELTLDTRFDSEDWRSKYFGPENLGPSVERVERLRSELGLGESLPAIALRFVLSNPTVSTVIVGMRSPSHVIQNIAAADAGPLTTEMMQRLRAHRWDRQVEPWAN